MGRRSWSYLEALRDRIGAVIDKKMNGRTIVVIGDRHLRAVRELP